MAKLIGTDPNQVPTNADLGTMAYQDYDSVAPVLIGGRRNFIINGDMRIAQRATSSTGNTASGFKTVDRFQMSYGGGSSTGTFDITQQADGPEGFKYSTKVIQKGSATSPNEYALRCFLENQDIRQVFGKFVTFSFYYKSNRTGEHAVRISHNNITGAVTKNIPFTVDTANTWERKTLLLDNFVNATATSQADTAWGIHVDIGIYMQGVGTIPVAVDEYFQVTGVQLEVGKVATPFEHRSYGEELAACSRYTHVLKPEQAYGRYRATYNDIGVACNTFYEFPVEMRSVPTLINNNMSSSTFQCYSETDGGFRNPTGAFTLADSSKRHAWMSCNTATATAGAVGMWRWNNYPSASMVFDAEL
jgi:hypothetical protein